MRYIIPLSLAFLIGCKTNSISTGIAQDRAKVQSALGGEARLGSDREELKELRKDVPAETQKTNDELALFLNLMGQGRENPASVREKFQSLVYKRRTSFREKTQKLREDYRREETKRRDKFLAEQKSKRDSFVKRKNSSSETREFFSAQDRDRQSFFADERARRASFESELSTESKDFDSYMRTRQKEFDEQYRLYSKKFYDRPKDKNAVTGDEFRKLDEAPTSPLGTED